MATKTLYLVRHAKSSWDEPLDDHDRPLAPRGRRAALAMAEHMSAEGLVPDQVLCSAAVRARQTWERMAPILGETIPVDYDDALYLAGPAELLARIRATDGYPGSLLLVGHNPGLEELADGLASRGNDALRDRLRQKYPTGALAVLEIPGDDWSAAAPGAATLARFVRPKDLPGAERRRL